MVLSIRAKIYATVIVLVALWGIHEIDKGYAIREAVSSYQNKAKEAITRSERATQALEASSVSDKKQLYEKIDSLVSERDAAIAGLRDRERRSSKTAKIGSSCTGRELYREDAEFLTREAARAEKVKEERDFYYRRYEEARQKLEGIKND